MGWGVRRGAGCVCVRATVYEGKCTRNTKRDRTNARPPARPCVLCIMLVRLVNACVPMVLLRRNLNHPIVPCTITARQQLHNHLLTMPTANRLVTAS